MKYLIFDTETTGLPLHPRVDINKQPKIIEFAGIIAGEGGEEISSHQWLIDPEEKLEEKITKITGITDEDLEGKPKFRDVEPDITKLFKGVDCAIAHNMPFDSSMINFEYKRLGLENPITMLSGSICTVQEHAEIWGYRPKLTQLYEHYTGEPLKQTHRALDDVRALLRVCVCAGIV